MLVGLFKTLFFILVIYFIGKVISRFVLPLFLRSYVNKIIDPAKQQQQQARKQPKKNEGEVTVDYTPDSHKTFRKDEGDYVDFEEIK